MAVPAKKIRGETFTVTEVAQLTGISPETLRRMDRRGQIKPSIGGSGAKRYYTNEDLRLVREMVSGKKRTTCTSIGIINQKGGVGKTTITINLGGALAASGYSVLIVDMDPQANCTMGLGCFAETEKEEIASMAQVLCSSGNANAPTRPITEIIRNVSFHPNLFLAPSHLDLAGTEQQLISAFGRETRLDKALAAVRDKYDFILIDAPPSLGNLSINSIVASDCILIPIDGSFALEGCRQLLATRHECASVSNRKVDVLGALLNKQRLSTTMSQTLQEVTANLFGDKVFKTVLPLRASVDESTGAAIPVTFSDQPEAEPFFAIAQEVVERVREL